MPREGYISSSETPAVFGIDPYRTPLMLFNEKRGRRDGQDEDERMAWGKALQPAILAETSKRLRLEIKQHGPDDFEGKDINGVPLGYTPDGSVNDPSRGPGIVEAKNVDWMVFRDQWTETTAPAHIELQLQHQLLVADAKFGVIAALVGGNDLHLIHREPILEVQQRIVQEARDFLEIVALDKPPLATVDAKDIGELALLYPETAPDKTVERFGDPDLVEKIRMYAWAKEQAAGYDRTTKQLQAELLALAGDAGWIAADGVRVKISKAQIAGGTYTRKPYVRQTLKVIQQTGEKAMDAIDEATA